MVPHVTEQLYYNEKKHRYGGTSPRVPGSGGWLLRGNSHGVGCSSASGRSSQEIRHGRSAIGLSCATAKEKESLDRVGVKIRPP